MNLKHFCFLLFLSLGGKLSAQHCLYDGSIVLVLDIRNKETDKPVPYLDVQLKDKDTVAYFQASWKYTPKTKYPTYTTDYMRMVYVTQEMIDEVEQETKYKLPKSVLHKYILWTSPGVYKNGSYVNRKKGLYTGDMSAINIMHHGLIQSTNYIEFASNVLWQGCTATTIWKTEPDFQKVYFTTAQIAHFQRRKNGKQLL